MYELKVERIKKSIICSYEREIHVNGNYYWFFVKNIQNES